MMRERNYGHRVALAPPPYSHGQQKVTGVKRGAEANQGGTRGNMETPSGSRPLPARPIKRGRPELTRHTSPDLLSETGHAHSGPTTPVRI